MKSFIIDHGSALPKHHQVEHLLRKLIEQPEYQEGKLLPNEVDMAKKLGVSRNTVRQATNKLVFEKLLVRKKGIGTRVAKNSITTKLNKWTSFTHEMDEKGVKFQNYSLKISWVQADKELVKVFKINSKTKILKMERVRGIRSGPVVYFISFFHPRTGLTGNEDFSKPLYEMLEEEHHTTAALSKEGISAIKADKELSGLLHVKTGEPILFRKRIVLDPGGRPIEYNLGYYRADRFTYTIDIERG